MNDAILSISDRGQITIPQKIRDQIAVKHFICSVEKGMLLLKPLQTREEFLTELDEAEKDWEKKGGLNLSEVADKYNL